MTASQTSLRLHRSGGLWLWPVIVALALTGAAIGLEAPFHSMVGSVSPTSTTVWDEYADRAGNEPISPAVSFTAALEAARERSRQAGGFGEPASIRYSGSRGLYRVAFGGANPAGLGPTTVYVDGVDGEVEGVTRPSNGTAGDLVLRASEPLHAGRIAGLPGRIVVAVAGLVVVLLSVTGVVMWWLRRRRA